MYIIPKGLVPILKYHLLWKIKSLYMTDAMQCCIFMIQHLLSWNTWDVTMFVSILYCVVVIMPMFTDSTVGQSYYRRDVFYNTSHVTGRTNVSLFP